MKPVVDINCDLGEGVGNEALIMPWITSASIACGGHAGDENTMHETARLAIQHGVRIGAHPGYPDPVNFGRKSVQMNPEDLVRSLVDQVSLLIQIVGDLGGRVEYVKPHGALYNDAARNPMITLSIIEALKRLDQPLALMGLAGSVMLNIARDHGFSVLQEAFADRAYTESGTLVSRHEPGALILDPNQAARQAASIVGEGTLVPVSGSPVPIVADSLCIHGDNPAALSIVKKLYPAGAPLIPLGDSALIVRMGEEPDADVNRKVHLLKALLAREQSAGIVGLIPAYLDLTILFDPQGTRRDLLIDRVKRRAYQAHLMYDPGNTGEEPRLEIPVVYGGDEGPDLEAMSAHTGLTPSEIIQLHANREYRISMIGFTPGFCYLEGVDQKLAMPRRSEPRDRVPAGSVGIAGRQTGIYPLDSPGGWQIIGRTPWVLFDPSKEDPFLCKSGMRIVFKPAERSESNPERPAREPYRGRPDIRVSSPGFQTTVQDGGRYGFLDAGVPVSGALDPVAAAQANLLVGNEAGSALLEMLWQGPVLEFTAGCHVALTGANMRLLVNGREYPAYKAVPIRPGDTLSFAGLRSGFRSWLAVSGGIDVPPVFGSRSTCLRGSFGGLNGRALIQGDCLAIGPPGKLPSPAPVFREAAPDSNRKPVVVRIIPGPEANRFTLNGLRNFLGSAYSVSPRSDRMGLRLTGQPLEQLSGADIVSSGVVPGTIQVPGDGQPIILLNDCQTTGGYLRIGCVVSRDLPLLAQLRPGDSVGFQEVRLDFESRSANK